MPATCLAHRPIVQVAELGAAAKGHLSGATSPMSVLSAQTSLEADLSDYSEEEDEESEWSELAEASGCLLYTSPSPRD